MFVWLVLIAILGVLFAFPMKKRFINDEQLPFPDGRAAGVLMDALHDDDPRDGLLKAKLLAGFGAAAALIELLRDEALMRVVFAFRALPSHWDDLLYGDGALARWIARRGLTPRFHGLELRELSVQCDSSIILLATGGLIGIEGGVSMLLGGLLNYFVLAPRMIARGVIVPDALGHYGYGQIVVWSLWGAVAAMTTSSLYSFFSRPQLFVDAFRGLFTRRVGPAKVDVLAHIELPIRVSFDRRAHRGGGAGGARQRVVRHPPVARRRRGAAGLRHGPGRGQRHGAHRDHAHGHARQAHPARLRRAGSARTSSPT